MNPLDAKRIPTCENKLIPDCFASDCYRPLKKVVLVSRGNNLATWAIFLQLAGYNIDAPTYPITRCPLSYVFCL